MSLFDSIKGAIGDAAGPQGLLSNALAQVGGLQGILAKLQAGGLGDQVKSWVGTGANLPVSAEQIRSALGNEQVQQIAAAIGIPTDTVLAFLSEHLPKTVDQATPDGTLPPTA
ncbi:YidB family protein [Inquilinus sp. CA228]|uniref:YidB family protein n=1 Tax=Inquilinus sp. CA228 TaxID=3455609 RepID=UPI003F8CFED1